MTTSLNDIREASSGLSSDDVRKVSSSDIEKTLSEMSVEEFRATLNGLLENSELGSVVGKLSTSQLMAAASSSSPQEMNRQIDSSLRFDSDSSLLASKVNQNIDDTNRSKLKNYFRAVAHSHAALR